MPRGQKVSPHHRGRRKTHFLVRTSTIFGADVHDPKGCWKTLYKKSLRWFVGPYCRHQRFPEWSWRSFRRNWWRTSGEVWQEIFELLLLGKSSEAFSTKTPPQISPSNFTTRFWVVAGPTIETIPKNTRNGPKCPQWRLISTSRWLIATNLQLIATNQPKSATSSDYSARICDSFKAGSQNTHI